MISMSNTSGDRNGKAPVRSPSSNMRSLFKKMAHKKRAPRANSSTNELLPEYDVSCFCPSCATDPMHQEDHQRNEDARVRDVLHRAFGHANIDAARVGEGPSNPHVIPSSMDTGDESKASYDEQGDFRSTDTVRGSVRGAGLIQHKCIFSRIMSDRIGARLSSTVKIKLMYTPFHHFMDTGALVVDSMLLDDICGRYLGESQFGFGAFVLTCSDEDFGKILGLPHTGRKIELIKTSSKGTSNLHGKILTQQKIGLYLCLLFSGFMFTNARCTLRRKIISYIKDFDDICSYNWTGAVRDVTFSNIDYCRTRVLERECGGRTASVYMIGCPAALMVWALEHTRVAEPSRPDGCLPYQRWVDFRMDGPFELAKLGLNSVTEVPRMYKLAAEDADMVSGDV